MNLSLTHMRRNNAPEAIKHAKDALDLDPQNCKTLYRLSQAYRQNNDLDMSIETMKKAIEIEPNNRTLRKEYQEIDSLKKRKEKEWYSKMSGFLDSKKLKQIEKKDEDEAKLMHKIKRRCFERRGASPPEDDDDDQPEPLQEISN